MTYRRIVLATILLAASTIAMADSAPCGSTTYNLGNSGANALVPPGDASGGCKQIDINFINFSVAPHLSDPTVPGADISAQFNGTTSSNPVEALFSSPDWTTTSTTAIEGDIFFTMQTSSPWAIQNLTLNVVSSVGNNNVQVQEKFCTGTTTFNCGPNNGNYGLIEYSSIPSGVQSGECYNDGISGFPVPCASMNIGNSVVFSQPFTSIAFDILWGFVSTDGTHTATLNSISMLQGEISTAPEPSTGFLCLTVLSGLALRFWQRRNRARIR